jgi:hypothetical protein
MTENYYTKLAAVDISKQIEKKQNLSYLSWPFAVDQLMRHDPQANWEFHAPEMYGETMMISCTVTAFGKPIKMHLPVMDHRNQAVKNPDAFVVNKNMMRCLVKAIACHGLGINVYAGEDLPLDEDGHISKPAPKAKAPPAPPPASTPPPKKIEGKEGPWQLKVQIEPAEGNFVEWAEIVIESTNIMLGMAQSEADVMAVFRTNTNIYNRMKEEPGSSAYQALLENFKNAKSRFTNKEEE